MQNAACIHHHHHQQQPQQQQLAPLDRSGLLCSTGEPNEHVRLAAVEPTSRFSLGARNKTKQQTKQNPEPGLGGESVAVTSAPAEQTRDLLTQRC